jgi:hypothetical protein
MTLVAAHILLLSQGACLEGTKVRCSLAGCTTAYKYCEYPGFGPCECYDTPTYQTTTADAKYSIAAVWYSVPGPGSTTTYTAQSMSGTTTSKSNDCSYGFTIGVQNDVGFKPYVDASLSVSFGHTWSQSSTTAIDSKVTYQTDNTIDGKGADDVDHSRDEIVLLIKPKVVFTSAWLHGTLVDVKWALDGSGALLYPLQVGWLLDPATMPQNVSRDLGAWGVFPTDYTEMLKADPYAYDPAGIAQPASQRFECVEQLYYLPGLPNHITYSMSNSYSSTVTTGTSHTYKVKLGLEGTILSQKFSADNSWTWENSSSTANTSSTATTARLYLNQPSASYTGSTVLYVYVDKVYKTFLYSFHPPSAPTALCQ